MELESNSNNRADKLKDEVGEVSAASVSYGFKGSGKESKEIGRISNALNANIAMRKQLNLFSCLDDRASETLSLSDKAHYVDRKGKPISLSVEEIQVVKALSYYLPFDSPEIKSYIEEINRLGINSAKGETKKVPIQIPVSVIQLCKDIIGDTREASLIKMSERLERLEQVEQAQYFTLKDGSTFSVVRPLIRFNEKLYKLPSEIRSSRGRKKSQTDENKEERILVAANIIYSALFLYEATNKYCPIYKEKLFEVWRKNKTEIFAVLLSDLESKWRQYYINSNKAEKAAKSEHKDLRGTDKEEYNRLVAEAKKKALIYKSSTLTIRDRVPTDYETDRKQRSRFIPDLQRAIDSLIEYGIITEESRITKDKENVVFVYNQNFVTKVADTQLLLGAEN